MIKSFADLVVYNWLNFSQGSHLGEAVNFFVYDTIKIMLLLSVMIFVISIIRSFFQPERVKKLLSGKKLFVGNAIASFLGVVSPFCSCSTVPIFIGFVEAGVPLGVTFSFLITSPIVNEIALVLLYSIFGWQIATLYLVSGVTVGIVGGIIIGYLGLEDYVEEYVYEIEMEEEEIEAMTWEDRIEYAKHQVKDIVGRIWKFVMIGIAIGGLIHGYVPTGALADYAGPNNPFSVFVGVLFGIPLYSNAVGTIPIVESLMNKGVAVGTALSFMMATVALSVPQMVILRKVLKPKLIGIFITIVGVSIIGVGYLFNIVI
ncbi:permease [Acetohalobium arabaticum]|uniref:Permease n=1 Tax=Acetohalobium arabaticum (strain ATCC 49924 / DSM 5501 / Z-7288) TaxID=574087 RepID=D9QT16_ACEAZ|nr:permease [Acetohalobium arabaticum]ADL13516.1 permease [Acetohalobium arabaticum DSM 5501]